jgi:hypothetical protein
MFELHKQQNEEWIQLRKEENDKERKFVAEEKVIHTSLRNNYMY